MESDDRTGAEFTDNAIKEIISAHLLCDFDEMNAGSRFVEDLYADSMDVLDIFLQISETFDLDLDTGKLAQTRTVGALCQLVFETRASVMIAMSAS